MSEISPAEIKSAARELCAGEGWDPDEEIACEPGEAALAERVGEGWRCRRWQLYAGAAAELRRRQDDWEAF